MLVIGIVLPFTGIFVPSRVPFFITRAHAHEASIQQQDDEQKGDTTKRKKPRYSVRRTTTETTEDVKHRSSDLQDPDNLKTEVTYDEKDGTYQVGTTLVGKNEKGNNKETKNKETASKSTTSKSGDDKNTTNVKLGSFLPANTNGQNLSTATSYLAPPVLMTAEEYMNWSLRQSLAQYYRQRNQELFQAQGNNKFDFTDMRFSLGPAEKIFGPGGVRITTNGSAELKIDSFQPDARRLPPSRGQRSEWCLPWAS